MVDRQIFTGGEARKSSSPYKCYADPVCAALECLERLMIEGLAHGHFEYAISCETGNHGRRVLIIRAGKNLKFTIPESDCPGIAGRREW
jgi:hypothetical protein